MLRVAFVILIVLLSTPSLGNDFTLKNTCPPSFELTENNECKFVNLYQMYDSLQNKGVGGTQTALPELRDGFSPQKIDLGRLLFFDPVLSGTQTKSCATCHQPEKGFADGEALSTGANGEKTHRSSPSLWNVGFLKRFFWDGRATSLETQAVGPLFAANEMGNTPENLLLVMNDNKTYRQLFNQAFNKASDTDITLPELTEALAAFQSTLVSLNSRYDHYAHGYHQALTEREIAGMNIFRSFVARCSECHTPPLFTNQQIAVIGVPEPEGAEFDVGAEKTFNATKLKGGFKVPTLRNITKTAPYMHQGVFADLTEATDFYNKGRGHAIPEGVDLQIHWHIWEPDLTEEEIELIVEFMAALTDESLMPQIPKKLPSGLTPNIGITITRSLK